MAGEPAQPAATRHVRVYAIQTADAARYQGYRERMTPILHGYGGSFRHDFAIARVLASEASHPIDRVFAIGFPDRTTADRFFADPGYLAVRREWFDPAVVAITQIGAFDEPAPSSP